MAAEQTQTPGREIPPALTRYRVMANVVGVLLIALMLVAVPLKYLGGIDAPVTVIGTAHGWLYALFAIATVDLALRARWSPTATLLTLLGGTVPIVSFFAERRATARTRAGMRV